MVNNSNLAQQIASGKVQVATINGQQVLIRPTGNNQAQIVAQLTPSTVAQVSQVQQAIVPQTQSTITNSPIIRFSGVLEKSFQLNTKFKFYSIIKFNKYIKTMFSTNIQKIQ